jgi:hypothetical protein
MDINGVHRDTEDLAIEFGKWFSGRREVEHFRGADKGEIEWIKKENNPLLSVV